MFRIVEKTELAAGIFRMRVEAPRVAASALPGQFVIVRADEQGERVPLTVADYDRTAGTVRSFSGARSGAGWPTWWSAPGRSRWPTSAACR